LSGVQDLALNPIKAPVSWAFTVGNFNPDQASVTLSNVLLPAGLSNDAIITALFGANANSSQYAVQGTPAPMVRRRATSTSPYTVSIKPGSGDSSALSQARTALTSNAPGADFSSTLVAIMTPQAMPGNSTVGTNSTTSTNSTTPFFERSVVGGVNIGAAIGIAIAALVIIIALTVLIACCVARRHHAHPLLGTPVGTETAVGSQTTTTTKTMEYELRLSPPPPQAVQRTYVSGSGRSVSFVPSSRVVSAQPILVCRRRPLTERSSRTHCRYRHRRRRHRRPRCRHPCTDLFHRFCIQFLRQICGLNY